MTKIKGQATSCCLCLILCFCLWLTFWPHLCLLFASCWDDQRPLVFYFVLVFVFLFVFVSPFDLISILCLPAVEPSNNHWRRLRQAKVALRAVLTARTFRSENKIWKWKWFQNISCVIWLKLFCITHLRKRSRQTKVTIVRKAIVEERRLTT